MKCLKCRSVENEVIDSRGRSDDVKRRRRRCLCCGHKWTTYESVDGLNRIPRQTIDQLEQAQTELHRIGTLLGRIVELCMKDEQQASEAVQTDHHPQQAV